MAISQADGRILAEVLSHDGVQLVAHLHGCARSRSRGLGAAQLGAAGVPSRSAEVEEREIHLFLAKGVIELTGNPPQDLPGREPREAKVWRGRQLLVLTN